MSEIKNIPELRFPEFDQSWNKKVFGDLYTFKPTNSFSRDMLNYDGGGVKNIHYGDIHTKFNLLFNIEKEIVPFINSDINISGISEENYVQEGDLILADASEDYNDIGKSIEILNINNEKVLSGLHTILAKRKTDDLAIGFVAFLMKTCNVRLEIMRIAQGTKVLGLSSGRLAEVPLWIPKPEEQTKIATFLTVIDKRIGLLSQQKEQLELYKKGLMHKIFSQELRFKDESGKEFPEWEEKRLFEIGDIITGKTPSTSDLNLWNGDIQFITPTDISNDSKYQYKTDRYVHKQKNLKILPPRTIVYTCIASIGKMCITTKPSITNQQINSLIAYDSFDSEFVYYSLLYITPKIKSTQANTTLPIINKTEFSKFIISVPKSIVEQQKISSFLSKIDRNIDEIIKQIEISIEFKKGLFQKLFV